MKIALAICLLLSGSPIMAQWRAVRVSSGTDTNAIQENFRRASLWSNRKLDRFSNDTLYGQPVFQNGVKFGDGTIQTTAILSTGSFLPTTGGNLTGPVTNSSSITASAFSGNGAGLTGITIPNTLTSSLTITGSSSGYGLTVSSNVYVVGFSSATKYYGDGSSLTGVSTSGGTLSTTTVNGIPICGYIETGSTTPPTDFIYLNGQSLSTTTYAALFACPQNTGYRNGGSGASFNVEKWDGMFARGLDTTGTIDSEARVIGSTETDKFQGFGLAISARNTTTGYTHYHGLGFNRLGGPDHTRDTEQTVNYNFFRDDGTNGTPRTGNETRPKNIAVARHIRYQVTGTTAFSNTNLVTTTATYTAPTTFSNSVSMTATGPTGVQVSSLTVGALTVTGAVSGISNSSSTILSSAYSTGQTAGRACVTGSTITITTQNGSRVMIGVSGSWRNDTTGTSSYATYEIDGIPTNALIRYELPASLVNYSSPLSFTAISSPLSSGSHSVCLVLYVSGGTVTSSLQSGVFWAQELR